jgi:hypothetical protein
LPWYFQEEVLAFLMSSYPCAVLQQYLSSSLYLNELLTRLLKCVYHSKSISITSGVAKNLVLGGAVWYFCLRGSLKIRLL